MFEKVLVANRGEIARRIVRTIRSMGIRSVAVFSDADAHAPHVREADEAVRIGEAGAAASYLDGARVIDAARSTSAQAIHPGYGFLSENAEFAAECARAGVRFIGPTSEQIRSFGLKHLAREVAERQGVPLLPGSGLLGGIAEAQREARRLGYPVILKSTAGGGGIGLRVCREESRLAQAFESVLRVGGAHFGDTGAYLEKFIVRARHVEVQIFGDGAGGVVVLGERDCSAQRRNQKVIEETPAPGISDDLRRRLFDAALRLGRAVSYASAGTVEFVLDVDTEAFYFLEVNTRLQVEHAVTEEVTGIDLVEWMIRQADGSLRLEAAPHPSGAAIEVRIYAEDPGRGNQPSSGTLTEVKFGEDVRVDTWVETGTEVTPYYDPLLAKVIAHGATRADALARLTRALDDTRLSGLETNLSYLRTLVASDTMRSGAVTTQFLSSVAYDAPRVDVLDGGTQTTVQDLPGRLGWWSVGVPPSGPMDDRALCIANRLVGNRAGAPALEMTLMGPTLRFRQPATLALTGARMAATMRGQPVPYWEPFDVPAGAELRLGSIEGAGARTYLAVLGGFDVPPYLGSAATFMLGRFGGHGGRALRAGDVLRWSPAPHGVVRRTTRLDPELVPQYPEIWEIGVLEGPHAAPDFFTRDDIEALFAATWKVHYNSDRTGVRLVGPKPRWARADGGEAGLHPSNIHDNAYAVGTIDYTGDMPVILGPDGPSLGGFVCPATIVRAERWKTGQLKAGDGVRFIRMTEADAQARFSSRMRELETLEAAASKAGTPRIEAAPAAAILEERRSADAHDHVVYRRDGDDYLLVEYGPAVLDIGLRLRAHALMQALEKRAPAGIVDLTPGIRSLQVHYDPGQLSTARLLSFLRDLEADLPRLDEIEIPTRTVHLPLSWEDPATLLAIEKYMRSVRADAPWCPSNIEFIRRINGLESRDDVRRIVFDARYLVLGLGDVYLGAPVATPLDPRHRLVTTKYNPARTWTPENAVGIGGAYLCIYGMEGPGGYQFVGRTLQVWNTYRQTAAFREGKPYLLRFFDEIRFHPVEADELLRMRSAWLHGQVDIRIESSVFRYGDYRRWLAQNAGEVTRFKGRQQASFEAERERWRLAGQDVVTPALPDNELPTSIEPELHPGAVAVVSPIAGSVWKVLVEPGARVREGDPIAVVEAMKTEIAIHATASGVVEQVLIQPGVPVVPGQRLVVIGAPVA